MAAGAALMPPCSGKVSLETGLFSEIHILRIKSTYKWGDNFQIVTSKEGWQFHQEPGTLANQ